MHPSFWTTLGFVVLPPAAVVGLNLGAARASGNAVELGLVDGSLRPLPADAPGVSSRADALERYVPPLSFAGDPAEAWGTLLELFEGRWSAGLVTATDTYAHAATWTPYLKTAEDLEFELDAEAGVIHVRAVQRQGAPQLDRTRERVEDLRRRWDALQALRG